MISTSTATRMKAWGLGGGTGLLLNHSEFREVLDGGGSAPLSDGLGRPESGAEPPPSKTLARGSLLQCAVILSELEVGHSLRNIAIVFMAL